MKKKKTFEKYKKKKMKKIMDLRSDIVDGRKTSNTETYVKSEVKEQLTFTQVITPSLLFRQLIFPSSKIFASDAGEKFKCKIYHLKEFHELRRPNTKCRLFVDLDRNVKSGDQEKDTLQYFDELIQELVIFLKETKNDECKTNIDSYIVFDGTRELEKKGTLTTKYSYHINFPYVIFKNLDMMLNFMELFRTKMINKIVNGKSFIRDKKDIDTDIYKKGNYRIPFAICCVDKLAEDLSFGNMLEVDGVTDLSAPPEENHYMKILPRSETEYCIIIKENSQKREKKRVKKEFRNLPSKMRELKIHNVPGLKTYYQKDVTEEMFSFCLIHLILKDYPMYQTKTLHNAGEKKTMISFDEAYVTKSPTLVKEKVIAPIKRNTELLKTDNDGCDILFHKMLKFYEPERIKKCLDAICEKDLSYVTEYGKWKELGISIANAIAYHKKKEKNDKAADDIAKYFHEKCKLTTSNNYCESSVNKLISTFTKKKTIAGLYFILKQIDKKKYFEIGTSIGNNNTTYKGIFKIAKMEKNKLINTIRKHIFACDDKFYGITKINNMMTIRQMNISTIKSLCKKVELIDKKSEDDGKKVIVKMFDMISDYCIDYHSIQFLPHLKPGYNEIFYPGVQHCEIVYNTFVDIPIIPHDASKVELYLNTLVNYFRHLSGCNKTDNYMEFFEYILKWVAWIFRHRQKIGIVLMLIGDAGSGKTLFFQFLKSLFNNMYCTLITNDEFFNSKFNSDIEDKIICYLDEFEIKTKGDLRTFKQKIQRSSDTKISRKFENSKTIDTYENYIASANEINQYIDYSDRRTCIIETNDKLKDTEADTYIKLLVKQSDSAHIHVVRDIFMNKIDLTNFNPNKFPVSDLKATINETKIDNFSMFLITKFHEIREHHSYRQKKEDFIEEYNIFLSEKYANTDSKYANHNSHTLAKSFKKHGIISKRVRNRINDHYAVQINGEEMYKKILPIKQVIRMCIEYGLEKKNTSATFREIVDQFHTSSDEPAHVSEVHETEKKISNDKYSTLSPYDLLCCKFSTEKKKSNQSSLMDTLMTKSLTPEQIEQIMAIVNK